MPVTMAILPHKAAYLPTACAFDKNVGMWDMLQRSIPDPAERLGAARVADCLAAVLHQAYGLPIAAPDGLLAMPHACIEAVLQHVQAYTALRPTLAAVTSPAQVLIIWENIYHHCDVKHRPMHGFLGTSAAATQLFRSAQR